MADSDSLLSAPKYLTIAQDLKDKIQGNVYSVGNFLPPENDLVKIYSASRPTIRAAIAKLREVGLLEVVHGRGTKVADHKIYQQIGSQLSFTDVIEAQGFKAGTKVIEARFIKAPLDIAEKFGIHPGDSLFTIGRLRTADDEIIGYQLAYLRPEYSVQGEKLEDLLSLYRYLEEIYHLSILFTDDTIWAEPATSAIAHLLNIRPGKPVLRFERLAYTSDNRMIELASSYVRSDRFKYKERVYRKGKTK